MTYSVFNPTAQKKKKSEVVNFARFRMNPRTIPRCLLDLALVCIWARAEREANGYPMGIIVLA